MAVPIRHISTSVELSIDEILGLQEVYEYMEKYYIDN